MLKIDPPKTREEYIALINEIEIDLQVQQCPGFEFSYQNFARRDEITGEAWLETMSDEKLEKLWLELLSRYEEHLCIGSRARNILREFGLSFDIEWDEEVDGSNILDVARVMVTGEIDNLPAEVVAPTINAPNERTNTKGYYDRVNRRVVFSPSSFALFVYRCEHVIEMQEQTHRREDAEAFAFYDQLSERELHNHYAAHYH